MSDTPPAKARECRPAIARALTNTALMERARDALERRLAADPRDEDALLGLGDLARREGKFAQAIAAYRALRKLRGDAASAWAIGGGEPLGAPPDGCRAAPFIRRADFLRPAEQEKLQVALSAGPEAFQPATVGRKIARPEYRAALAAKRRPLREKIRPLFIPKLRAVLPDVAARLGVIGVDDGHVEISLTATLAGGFYRIHRDRSGDLESPYRTRAISYVYYCHREPKPFTGGELLLYDTCPGTKRFARTRFSRIDPKRNTLVLFPSCYYHEILPGALRIRSVRGRALHRQRLGPRCA